MLSLFPNEISQDVFDKLSIHDCKSILTAYKELPHEYQRIEGIYEKRVCLKRYFSCNLFDGAKIMKLLAESDSYLTGSRAIEYFTPGVIGNNSDWNFMLSASVNKRCHFMKSMEQYGVTWKTATESFLEKINKGSLSITIKHSELTIVIVESRKMNLTDFHKIAIGEFKKIHSKISPSEHIDKTLFFHGIIGTDSFKYRDITDDIDEDDFTNMIVMEGKMIHKGKEITIDISYVNDQHYTIVNALHDFCLSAQQCFISGFGALHMYGKLMSSGVSYKWNREGFEIHPSNHAKNNGLIHKHTIRGCQIKLRSYHEMSMINQRSYNDNESTYIPHDNELRWNENMWKLMQMRSCYMQWYENGFDTYFQYTKYSNYFSMHFMDKCDEFRQSLIMPLDESYMRKHATL